ncbi:Anthranilate phosphoribosyltransferase [hydrothermal vent metagenome]|uniref:anthranilate phosphoribosyltransferase n=1 Tax=hydrothermal vent metagenome TaxID=652676 RepID=A0A3B1CEQ7_9ZZZZ
MEGSVADTQLAAFLTALNAKGESVGEIVGAARVMRQKADKLKISSDNIVDTCGTGGDGGNTFNISTASAFVVAGAGITVAKHGNRAVSSRSGSADVLKCLGVNIDADKTVVEKCIEQVGMGFLFAPLLHGAMKYAAPVRKKLGVRTIFNLLGPLTNPANAHAQVIGVFDKKWVSPIAHVLQDLGSRHAFVVHGEDGLDEISLMDETYIAELVDGEIHEYRVSPEKFGLQRCSPEQVQGGAPEENAKILKSILQGEGGPKADIVLLNASAAICAGGKASSIEGGLVVARQSIDSGAAKEKLLGLCDVSHS